MPCGRLRVKEKNGNSMAAVCFLISSVENKAEMTGLCFDGREQKSKGTPIEKIYIAASSKGLCGDGA